MFTSGHGLMIFAAMVSIGVFIMLMIMLVNARSAKSDANSKLSAVTSQYEQCNQDRPKDSEGKNVTQEAWVALSSKSCFAETQAECPIPACFAKTEGDCPISECFAKKQSDCPPPPPAPKCPEGAAAILDNDGKTVTQQDWDTLFIPQLVIVFARVLLIQNLTSLGF